MPFIGVRISWLMLATKSLFARLAASAASFACCSASSPCLRSVTSRPIAWIQRSWPECSIGRVASSIVATPASGVMTSSSKVRRACARSERDTIERARARGAPVAARSASCRPITSCRRRPSRRSPARLTDVIVPVSSQVPMKSPASSKSSSYCCCSAASRSAREPDDGGLRCRRAGAARSTHPRVANTSTPMAPAAIAVRRDVHHVPASTTRTSRVERSRIWNERGTRGLRLVSYCTSDDTGRFDLTAGVD